LRPGERQPTPAERTVRAVVVALAVGAVALGTGGLIAHQTDRAKGAPAASGFGVVSIAAPTAAPSPDPEPSGTLSTHSTVLGAQGSNAAAPVRLSIPRLHLAVDPAATGLAADNRSLDLPESAAAVVWWAYGATPGSGTGTVLLAGHISWAGRVGVLSRIGTLRRGDRVVVTRQDGRAVRYAVVGRRQVPKMSLADLGLFRTTGSARLVLVTCGGRYDAARHSYEDNVVVQAIPV
jgi:hypothetical protein